MQNDLQEEDLISKEMLRQSESIQQWLAAWRNNIWTAKASQSASKSFFSNEKETMAWIHELQIEQSQSISHISPETKHNLSNIGGRSDGEESFGLENLLRNITNSSTPGRPIFGIKSPMMSYSKPQLFIETSFEQQREEEMVKEVNDIWEECKKSIDQL